jgi:hypothetical protein
MYHGKRCKNTSTLKHKNNLWPSRPTHEAPETLTGLGRLCCFQFGSNISIWTVSPISIHQPIYRKLNLAIACIFSCTRFSKFFHWHGLKRFFPCSNKLSDTCHGFSRCNLVLDKPDITTGGIIAASCHLFVWSPNFTYLGSITCWGCSYECELVVTQKKQKNNMYIMHCIMYMFNIFYMLAHNPCWRYHPLESYW